MDLCKSFWTQHTQSIYMTRKTSHKYLPALRVGSHGAYQEPPDCGFKTELIVDVASGCLPCLISVHDNDQIKKRESRQENEMEEKLVSVCGQTMQNNVFIPTPLESNMYIMCSQPSSHAAE